MDEQASETCRNGHTRTEQNTYWWKGERYCRDCRSRWQRKAFAEGRAWKQQPQNQARTRDMALKYLHSLPYVRYARTLLMNRRSKALQRMAKRHQRMEALRGAIPREG